MSKTIIDFNQLAISKVIKTDLIVIKYTLIDNINLTFNQ